MKIVTNQSAIKRYSNIGMWASFLSPILFLLSGSTYLSSPANLGISLLLLLFGFIFFQTGIAFKKWGRGAEEAFSQALKKLGNDYTLYNFHTPVSHLLVGPAGIWILIPKFSNGEITYNMDKKKWKLSRKSLLKKLISILLEGIGRPHLEIIGEADALDRHLQKSWIAESSPHVDAALVFINQHAVINADNAPVPTIHLRKLREFIRSQEKINRPSHSQIKAFKVLFDS